MQSISPSGKLTDMIELTPQFYSVSRITSQIKGHLESQFGDVGIEGEISNFRPSAAGHWYFTLKDEHAAISAVMFKGRTFRVRFTPKDGMNVRVIGTVSVYEKRGVYQIICEAMDQAGAGDILLRLEELKRRLQEEGLFDPQRKQPIPKLPKTVGVITSSTGAALRDILNVLSRRNSGIHVVIYPALVQGDGAAEEIARQIETANRLAHADVLIVGRGGGSLEDLLPFSDERAVRAVAASSIPVISAVGHEVDWALSDFTADLRAATPSAAAELVSATREELALSVTQLRRSLAELISSRIERTRLLLQRYSPEDIRERFTQFITPRRLEADELAREIQLQMHQQLQDRRYRISLAQRELHARSPQAMLERGFSVVTRRDTGETVTDAQSCSAEDLVDITFAKGSASAKIEEIHR